VSAPCPRWNSSDRHHHPCVELPQASSAAAASGTPPRPQQRKVPSNPWNKFQQNPELEVWSIIAVDAQLMTWCCIQRVSTISGEELQQHPGLNSLSTAAVDAQRNTRGCIRKVCTGSGEGQFRSKVLSHARMSELHAVMLVPVVDAVLILLFQASETESVVISGDGHPHAPCLRHPFPLTTPPPSPTPALLGRASPRRTSPTST
jgi:hypothetical protein